MTTRPLVTVIIPHRDRLPLLQACLRSLRAQTEPRWRAVVVDNGSQDGSAAYVARLRGRLSGLCLPQNRGFTGACWAGLRALPTTPFVILLNNDVVLQPDWLALSLQAARAHPAAASIASRILRFDNGLIDSAGHFLSRAGRGHKRGEGQRPELWSQAGTVFGAPAAAVLYRRAALDEVGFLDDAFYFNCEDLDLDLRLHLRGWDCWYEPRAMARHHVSASHAILGPQAIYYWSRNIELITLKSFPFPLLLGYAPVKLIQEGATMMRRALMGQPLGAYFRGKLGVISLLGHVWRERRKIQSSRRRGSLALARSLSSAFSLKAWDARWIRLRQDWARRQA
jgi:GT2 family glycosyltransferase